MSLHPSMNLSFASTVPRRPAVAPQSRAVKPGNNLRFGWTAESLRRNPESYQIHLQPDDIVWTEDKTPVTSLLDGAPEQVAQDASAHKGPGKILPRLKPEKIRQILKTLSRESLDQPGFVVVDKLEEVLKTPQAMNLFFRQLMVDLDYVVNNHPDSREYYGLNQGDTPHLLVSGLKYLTDGKPRFNHKGEPYPAFTHKAPHFDKGPVLAGLLHLPVTGNIEGGVPELYDIEDYMAQHPDIGIPATTKITRGKTSVDHDKEEINPEILAQPDFKDYTLQLPRPEGTSALVLFNNRGPGRVAHGASPLKLFYPAIFRRDIVRYTLRPTETGYNTKDDPRWVEHYPPAEPPRDEPGPRFGANWGQRFNAFA